MSSKEDSVKAAKVLYNKEGLAMVGQGFYRYLEPISDEMISRKGLEREASAHMAEDLTLIIRHDIEINTEVNSTRRVAILQVTADYEKEQERALASRVNKLQSKYAK